MTKSHERDELDPHQFSRSAEMAMSWFGWGSPIGLGLFVIAIGVTVLLFRYAIWPA